MISVAQAWQIIADHLPQYESEVIPVAEATGRTLAERVLAERQHPPFDRVTMDGCAVSLNGALPPRLRIVGTCYAGEPAGAVTGNDTTVEIMTGAPLANGANTVIPVERYRIIEEAGARYVVPEPGYVPERGQFIHRAGSDHGKGACLLEPGVTINAIEMAILLSAGLTHIAVSRLPKIDVIATGNELVAAGRAIADHQIRLSNAPAVATALARHGFDNTAVHHIVDDIDDLQQTLGGLVESGDVLVLSGGVSKGKADFVPEVLDKLGIQRHFHFVAQRPGKPMWFGTAPNGALVFALPGNPVSTISCARRYVIPAMQEASGLVSRKPPTAQLATDWQFAPALTAFVPASVQLDDNGKRIVTPLATNTSGDFAALAASQGFVELPAKQKSFAAGEAFPWYAW